jgi:hypothetical protein
MHHHTQRTTRNKERQKEQKNCFGKITTESYPTIIKDIILHTHKGQQTLSSTNAKKPIIVKIMKVKDKKEILKEEFKIFKEKNDASLSKKPQ